MQLSSLALPAHPFAIALVPHALAMEEKKAFPAAGGRTIFLVQPRDAIDRDGQQIVVSRQSFARCIQPIREQREAQVSIRIRQVMNFQPLDLFCDFLRGGQQRGHDHDRSQVLRDAVAQFHVAAVFAVQANPSLRG